LKSLGITTTTLFREITKIQEAMNLWTKINSDKKKQTLAADGIVQMEDSQGNVMPERVYHDLMKQGLL
jgi:splicing factor 3A subunit 3